jgi:CheY-like chemotaxis protein
MASNPVKPFLSCPRIQNLRVVHPFAACAQYQSRCRYQKPRQILSWKVDSKHEIKKCRPPKHFPGAGVLGQAAQGFDQPHFELPREAQLGQDAIAFSTPLNQTHNNIQFPVTISVVDDERCIRDALGRLLRALGFTVHTFASGPEFLESLSTRRPDCALLDLHLPGLSGLEVQRHLTNNNVGLACIIITGRDEPGIRDQAISSGAKAYLTKPLDEQTLLAAISSALSERPAA